MRKLASDSAKLDISNENRIRGKNSRYFGMPKNVLRSRNTGN